MTKGKPWTPDEETKLKDLVQAGENLDKIAAKLGRRREAVAMKATRLGLQVVVVTSKEKKPTTTSLTVQLPQELPSQEEALKMLAGAFKTATKPGLTRVEVHRLKVLSTIARAYDLLLANYVRYREIETRLTELEQKYAQLTQKTQNNASKPNNAQMAQPPAQ